MRIILLVFICAALSGCLFTKESDVDKYAKSEGWQNARYDGYNWFGCSKGDWYHTGFKAVKNGQEISGTICSGLFFKNSTIRYD